MATRPAKPAARPGKPAMGKRPNFRFFREVVSELKKVTWPSREEATNLTTIVIIVAVAVGLFLGLIDYGFSQVINFLLLRTG